MLAASIDTHFESSVPDKREGAALLLTRSSDTIDEYVTETFVGIWTASWMGPAVDWKKIHQ